MSNEVINPYQTFYDDSGIPLADGTISFLVNTKTALGTIFSDEALLVEQANPYPLDASGRIAGDVKYTGLRTLLIKTDLGATVRTIDNVSTMLSSSDTTINKSYLTLNAAVADATNLSIGQTIYLEERVTGKGGGAHWGVIASTTNDEFSIVDAPLNTLISLKLVIGETITPEQVGVITDWNGSTGTSNDGAYQAWLDIVDTGVKGDMTKPFKVISAGVVTKNNKISGINGISKIVMDGNFIGLHANLTFASDPQPKIDWSGFSVEHISGDTGTGVGKVGNAIKLTNVINSTLTNVQGKFSANDWVFAGENFSNTYTKCRSQGGTDGWEQLTGTNNNNTFISCYFIGYRSGENWEVPTISMTHVNCDYSSVNESSILAQHIFTDIVNIDFHGGHHEGNVNFPMNVFNFSSTLSTNGQVIFNGGFWKGSSAKTGTLIKSNTNVNVTIINPIWNGFDIGFDPTGVGRHVVTNRKAAVINTPVKFSNLDPSAGSIREELAGRTHYFDSTGETGSFGAGTSGTTAIFKDGTRTYTVADGDPTAGDAGGSLHMRANGTVDRANGLFTRVGGIWFRHFPDIKGTTAERPDDTKLFSSDIGIVKFYDTTIELTIVYVASASATKWHDMAGNDV